MELQQTLKQSHPLTEVTLTQVRDTLNELAADINKHHYRIGLFYNLVVEKKMATMGGFKSSQEFFGREVKAISQTVLSTCGTVAKAFSEAACSRHGVYHLYALMAYARATKLKLSKEEPGPTPIDVPKEDGTVEPKPFAECSVEELKEAVKAKRAKNTPRLPDEALARIQVLRDNIIAKFPEDAARTRITARVHEDKTYITLKDVLVDDLELLAEALLDSLDTPRIAA